LLRLGGAALLGEELLALVLGTGTAHRSAVEVARAVLSSAGGLVALSRATSIELSDVPGLGEARAARVVAAFELGRRALVEPMAGTTIGGPSDVYDYLSPRLRGSMQEVFWVLALDARNTITSELEIARGTLMGVDVHPREVFRPLIRQAAAAAVVAHNHPSGDPTPSELDLALTRRLRRAGDLLGIPLLDHLVIGADGFASIAELIAVEDDWEGLS
jgi:DNA repair protein RadC